MSSMNAGSILSEPSNAFAEFFGLPLGYVSLIMALALGVFVFSRSYFTTAQREDYGLNDYLQRLRWISRIERLYRRGLLRCLRRLDGWLGEPRTALRVNKEHSELRGWRLQRWFNPNPWTGALYDRCLFLAVLYPILAFIVWWIISGNGALGGVILIDPLPGWQRALTFVGLILCFGLLWYANRTSGWKSNLAVVVATVVAVVIAVAGALVAAAVAVAGAVALALARNYFAGALAGAVASVSVVAGAVAVDVAGIVDFSVAVAGVGGVAAIVFYGWLMSRLPERGVLIRSGFWASFLLNGGCLYGLSTEFTEESRIILLFLGVLPLVNAPLDWLSLGLTRGLLRAVFWRIVPRIWRWCAGIFDAGLAFGLMFVLVAVVIGVVSLLNAAAIAGGGPPLVDIPGVLAAIRTDPRNPTHYWVYFLFFSTLIPTVIHLGVALVGLFTYLGAKLGEVVAFVTRVRAKGSADSYLKLTAPLTVTVVTCAGGLLIGLLFQHYSALGVPFLWLAETLLDTAEGLANWVGSNF